MPIKFDCDLEARDSVASGLKKSLAKFFAEFQISLKSLKSGQIDKWRE